MDDLQYISKDGDKWRVRVPAPEGGRRHVGMFDTVEAATEARDGALSDAELQADARAVYGRMAWVQSTKDRPKDIDRFPKSNIYTTTEEESLERSEALLDRYRERLSVSGATLDEDETDVDALWQAAFQAQTAVQQQQAKKRNNSIALPNEPVALAFLSDLHFGSAGTDYRAAKQDAETIRNTLGMYAAFHGDMIDNWIIGKLTGLQRYQAMNGDAEMRLFASWLEILRDKLLVVVSGNHDLWSHKLAGIDIVAQHLRGVRCLYDKHQVILNVDHGTTRRKVVVRHKWRFNSVYNPTHGLEVGWDRGDVDYDWAVGGHTHQGTYFRDFHRHGKRRTAILTGAYKRVDGFADEIGFASCKDNGCGAKVLHPDGREWAFNNLQEAAAFLGYLRGE